MYEHRKQPPLTSRAFLWRVAKHIAVALLIVAGSVAGGMVGYAYFEALAWPDAFLHAPTILGGQEPIAHPLSNGGKLFVGVFALYAELVFVTATGIVLAPLAHRVLHLLHWDAPR
jgi:hypothetical protein